MLTKIFFVLCVMSGLRLGFGFAVAPTSESNVDDETLWKVPSYCLFHVDLKCRITCMNLDFTNGKCYKGICVCKGAETKSVRKLRLSGQMILPYLMSSKVHNAGATSEEEHQVVYDKGMLDSLVEAGQVKEDTTAASSQEDEFEDHRQLEHRPQDTDDTYALTDEVLNPSEDMTSTENMIVGREDVDQKGHGRETGYIMSPAPDDVPRVKPHQHPLRHHRFNRHHNTIFKLGNPRNLKGTILGVAKEYDPQHLFSGEEKTPPSPTIDKVIIKVSETGHSGKAAIDNVASIIAKLVN